MVVQHNLTAMNANRMLGLTQSTQAKSTEKLSSGYKINRAADDAAGLSISEKMRKQIRGLTQASLNAEDGISAVQTAEGALNEVQDMLQRMNELAVKASNGTMSEDDRNYIQDEIDQLVTEIDRVAETTKFNETYLLKGVEGTETTEATTKATFEIEAGKEYAASYTLKTNAKYWAVKYDGTEVALTDATTATDLAKYINADGSAVEGYTIYAEAKNDDNEYGAHLDPVDAATVKANLTPGSTGLVDFATGEAVTDEDLASGKYFDTVTGSYLGGLGSFLSADGEGLGDAGNKGDLVEIGADQINDFVAVTVESVDATETTVTNALNFKLHVGADCTDNNQISVDIKAMDATSLGLREDTARDGVGKTLLVNGANDENARDAITVIAKAIQDVSTQRSALGAVQNRLEHTIANLDNVVENTTAAEAQIRDTDMATEMVKYSNNNILAQAGQAMLAQANQANQGVLSLLG